MLTKKAPLKPAEKPAKDAKCVPNNANIAVETLLKSSLNTKTTQNPSKVEAPPAKKAKQKTKITIKLNAGFSNELYIRGEGANLSWEKGQKLTNICADEWVWETNQSFSKCEFKILLNDKKYEKGHNHSLHEGACIQYTPDFS